MFLEQEFVDACGELDVPNTEGWEFFTESHDIKIYRQYNKSTGLYSYKIYGQIKRIDPELCSRVYMDLDYRKKWDSYVKELREVSEADDRKFIYWQVKYPFPLYNRDYVYVREMKKLELNGSTVWVILAKAAECNQLAPRSGVVRVVEYDQSLAITSDQENGTRAFMRYYDNPGGSIPTWLINWAAKSGVPGFLSDMQKACEGYPTYLQNTNRA
jgi:hypothetical protein